MADTVGIKDASNATVTIASDDIGSVQYQRIKLIHGADGTNDGDVSTANPLPVAMNPSAMVAQTYNVSGVIALNTILLSQDCNKLRGVAIQITSFGSSGTMVCEVSNDNSTWVQTPMLSGGNWSWSLSTAGLYKLTVAFRYVRFRMSVATTSGSTTFYFIGTECDLGEVNVSYVTPGIGSGQLGKAEDAVAGSGDTGVAVWAVRRDSPATNVNAAGDYAEFAVNGVGALWVTPTFAPGKGASPFQLISAASTNATNVKSSAGTLVSLYVTNSGATWAYLKFHNTSGTPTAGSGVVWTIPLPPGGGGAIPIPSGLAFATGIGVTVTGAAATNDTTNVAANQVVVALTYH